MRLQLSLTCHFPASLSKLDQIIARLEINNLTENEINTEIARLTKLAQENFEAMLYLACIYEEGKW